MVEAGAVEAGAVEAGAVEAGAKSPAGQLGDVILVCPGGLSDGGGIGRQMGYFLEAQSGAPSPVAYQVLDPRGRWFLGAAPGRKLSAALRLMGAMATLARVRLSARATLVHVNIAGRGSTLRKLALTEAARLGGLPYLLHVHDPDYAADFAARGKLMQKLVGRMFRAARRVIVLGERDRTVMRNLLGVSPERILVFHNAVPDPGPVRRRLGEDGTCRILFLGHLSERKGVPELLRALARTNMADPAWHATLAGGGPVEVYRDQASRSGIDGRVDFPGWIGQDAVRDLLETADIVVLPSHAEGLAMAVLEGISYGKAVITTRVGAHEEVIEDGVSGLFVPCGDAAALANAMRRVMDDPELKQSLQSAARETFLRHFEIRGYASRLADLHAELLANG